MAAWTTYRDAALGPRTNTPLSIRLPISSSSEGGLGHSGRLYDWATGKLLAKTNKFIDTSCPGPWQWVSVHFRCGTGSQGLAGLVCPHGLISCRGGPHISNALAAWHAVVTPIQPLTVLCA